MCERDSDELTEPLVLRDHGVCVTEDAISRCDGGDGVVR
jgi:hypothetical protein